MDNVEAVALIVSVALVGFFFGSWYVENQTLNDQDTEYFTPYDSQVSKYLSPYKSRETYSNGFADGAYTMMEMMRIGFHDIGIHNTQNDAILVFDQTRYILNSYLSHVGSDKHVPPIGADINPSIIESSPMFE